MQRDQLIQKLTATFLVELRDHVQTIERDLLALEQSADETGRAALYGSLFRSAHSLKGAARAVGAGLVETACHRLEEIVQAFRDGVLAPDGEAIQLFLATADAIGEAGAMIGERRDLSKSMLASLLPRLNAATEQNDAPPPAIHGPAAAPDAAAPADGPAIVEGTAIRGQGETQVVRIPAAKLDALLTQNEQLLVARRRGDGREEMAASLQGTVRQWQAEWSELERNFARARGDAERHPDAVKGGETAEYLARHRADLRRFDRAMQKLFGAMAAGRRQIDQTAAALGEEIRHVRMLPFSNACEGLDRAVRDLTANGEKRARLVFTGAETEIDRSLIEGLRDPLLQMVRNAIDHGIEPADERRVRGKPPEGRISINVILRGTQIEVAVADDGRGIDTDAIKAEVKRKDMAAGNSDERLLDRIFMPGFSTSATVTTVSGRGFGLDIVKNKVEAMRGAVEVSSQPGRGTRFKLTLPLTLTTIRGLLVRAGGQIFALDTMFIRKLLRVAGSDIHSAEGRAMILGEEAPIALASLAGLLGLPETRNRGDERAMAVVVFATGKREAAISVDELLDEQDLLVRSLGPRLKHVKNVAGGTVLPSGRIALILHTHDLLRGAIQDGAGQRPAPKPAERSKRKRRLVIADDSMTTRTFMKTILEGAGYDVFAASDGSDAWHLLQDGGADLVVTDVEMPVMDGFTLTETIRNSSQFHELPVILMTALETEQDKARGLRAGANAYLTKSTFDQRDLLATIQQIL